MTAPAEKLWYKDPKAGGVVSLTITVPGEHRIQDVLDVIARTLAAEITPGQAFEDQALSLANYRRP
jgi:Flp pilus assembly protein TadG